MASSPGRVRPLWRWPVSDLIERAEKLLMQCGIHDYGLAGACTCSPDHRPIVIELIREIQRLRDELGSARDWEAWENAQAEIKKLRAECVQYDKDNTDLGIALAEARVELLPVCAECGHRHRWGGECADHSWTDACPYDADANCEAAEGLPSTDTTAVERG